jgi:single-strand DNA-binding protein
VYQQTIIIGNVGRESELRYTPSGQGVCSFSVAVSRKWTDRNSNEKKEKTTWFKVSAWRQLAETCSQYVHKGMQIMVIGEVEARAYTGNDGTPQVSLELTAREVKFLGGRGERGGSGGAGDDYSDSYGSDEPQDIPF